MNEDCKSLILRDYSYFESEFLNKLLNTCNTEYFQKDITRQNKLAVYRENKTDNIGIVLDLLNFTHPNKNASKEICSGRDITKLFNEGPHSFEEKLELLTYARGFIKLD
jgi:hypothetical protein